jgi:vacuolar-type H+-ATPase subunit I/STV1
VTTVFAVLTIAYGIAVSALLRWKRLGPVHAMVVHGVFLVLLLGGAGLVANTAHQGGILVHGLGVHSMLAQPLPAANAPANVP